MVSNLKKIMLISLLFSLLAMFNSCLSVDQREYLQQILPESQRHIFQHFDDFTETEKEHLFESIQKVDWVKFNDLCNREQSQHHINTEYVEFEPAIPSKDQSFEDCNKGDEVLRNGHKEGSAQLGFIMVAGGTGSGLQYPDPKGMFPATTLSNKSLYLTIIEKIREAALAHGHDKMYPLVLMLSDKTEAKTIAYIKSLDIWDAIKDRIIFVMQQQLPELIMNEQGNCEIFLKQNNVSFTGAGHGDAFDYVLNESLHVTGKIWDTVHGNFVEKEVVLWLRNIGVQCIQYTNVDNPLMPIDKNFIGAHVLSRNIEKEKTEHRAHISLMLVKKETSEDRLGNVIIVDGNKESIDYGTASVDIKTKCAYGDPSIRLVTLESLQGSISIEKYSFVKKSDKDADGNEIYVYKFEFSSGDKKRYGVEVLRDRDTVFAPIKNRDETHTQETPSTSKKLQSNYWKRIIQDAYPELVIPEDMLIELPWACDSVCMTSEQLKEKLDESNFIDYLYKGFDVLVTQQ